MAKRPINVEMGDFPYPLLDGPKESRYLTWVRNHSNYMAERGFLDYLRLIAVLVRGILVNFLTLLPPLLFVSLLSLFYRNLLVDWNGQAETQGSAIGFFATKGTELTVAGTWKVGDKLSTTLTAADGSTTEVVTTTVEAPTAAHVRDQHEAEIDATAELVDKIEWTTPGTDRIVAPPAGNGARFSISTAVEANSGTITRATGPDLTVGGTWQAGDTLTTRLTTANGSTAEVSTVVEAGATKVQVRDQHLTALEAKSGLFDAIVWKGVSTHKIVATPAKDGKPVIISTAAESTAGTFTVPTTLTVAGTWQTGDKLTTTLRAADGSWTRKIVTTVQAGATGVTQVRDQVASDLGANGLLSDIKWTPSRTGILAKPKANRKPVYVATAAQSASGTFTVPTTLTVAGTWEDGDTLTTMLTRAYGSTAKPVVTTVRAGATSVAQVRDQHKSALDAETGLYDAITWTTSGRDEIIAAPVEGGRPVSISAGQRAATGTFTSSPSPHVRGPWTPFFVTPFVLLFAGVWVLTFPVLARMSKVKDHQKTLETGTTSSVKVRDWFERSFGGFLLAILAIALIESFPLLVHFFRQFRLHGFGANVYPAVGSLIGVLIASNQILPKLGGLMRKLAMVLVGALGLLIPLLVILLVVEFVVYAPAYEGGWFLALYVLPVAIAFLILFAMYIGRESFTLKGQAMLLWLFARMLVLFVLVIGLFLVVPDAYNNAAYVLAWAVEIWIFCSLLVDVNLTSIHGLYRDRLAAAFLVGRDTNGDVGIEEDIDLQEICQYDAGSTAPYHLVNVTLNLQASKDIELRERNSDFFIFSKKFIGGERTGYCRSEGMEQVYAQIDLGTAMAISAAAAAPNMGKGTNPLMVAFLTLLNIRLGFWTPHPGRLEAFLRGRKLAKSPEPDDWDLQFERNVFPEELVEIERRWDQAYRGKPEDTPTLAEQKVNDRANRTVQGLVGIGFSGGGIRSATINLGIAQALHKSGVFRHIDYMSTVSGGGYLGSSISTLMRCETSLVSEITGQFSKVETKNGGEKVVSVKGTDEDGNEETCTYRYTDYAEFHDRVKKDAEINAGERILRRTSIDDRRKARPEEYTERHNSLMDRFEWRVRPFALLLEMLGKLDEDHKWVNLSDGGHIENLAAIELLRRRCKYIIIGDGEADPNLWFNGLATLVRYARIDLGIEIDICPEELRVDQCQKAVEEGKDNLSCEHWACGKITYPPAGDGKSPESGYLLYLKSSYTGDDEDEVINEYRHRNPAFPHESTADQFFDEGQFEAYRALGEHIAIRAITASGKLSVEDMKKPVEDMNEKRMSFDEMTTWFTELEKKEKPE